MGIDAAQETPLRVWTLEERKAQLNNVIMDLVRDGWQVMSIDSAAAQIVKPVAPTDGCLLAVLLAFGVVPGILYLLWF